MVYNIQEIKALVTEMFEVADRHNIKFTELARMLRLRSIKTLYRWKNGENTPQFVYIRMIEKLVEIDRKRKEELLSSQKDTQ
jgi:hypothetical protein